MNPLLRTIRRYRSKIKIRKNTWLFLNGFLLATLLYCYMEDRYEKRIFESLAHYIKEQQTVVNDPSDDILIQTLHLTHYLGKSRDFLFKNAQVSSVKSSLIRPVTFDLMTTEGACGSYAFIASRLLTECNIPNRILQMQVNGLPGGHILLEAKGSSGWVVLDPLYDLYFTRPDGKKANFKDVQANWDLYRNQVPKHYDARYKYEGVRYTNWEKVPVLMPFLKSLSYAIIGKERTDTFSLRTFLLRKFHIIFLVTAVLYSFVLYLTINRYVRSKKKPVHVKAMPQSQPQPEPQLA